MHYRPENKSARTCMGGLLVLVALLLLPAGSACGEAYPDFPALRGDYLGQKPPADVAQIFAPGILKLSRGFHSSVVFSSDGDEACWTEGAVGRSYLSRRVDGAWTVPELLPFDDEFGVREPMFARGDRRLYYLSRRPLDYDPVERERIWYVDREADGWSEPRVIDAIVAAHPTHWQFSLTTAGDLYFTSEAAGVKGQQDIYVARWQGESYLEPVSVGDAVNGDTREYCPFVAPDESYLIFSRNVADEHIRADLFISFRDETGKWSKAVNMGTRVNTLHNEVSPVVTPDGHYLFFLRASSEMNDVYWIGADLIAELKHQHQSE